MFGIRAAVLGGFANSSCKTEASKHCVCHMRISIVVWMAFVTRLSVAPPSDRQETTIDLVPRLYIRHNVNIPSAWKPGLCSVKRAAFWELLAPCWGTAHSSVDINRYSVDFGSCVNHGDELGVDRVDHSLIRADRSMLKSRRI